MKRSLHWGEAFHFAMAGPLAIMQTADKTDTQWRGASGDDVSEEDYERVFEGVSEPGRNFKIAASWQFGG